jgi:hypothetical protein
MPDFARSEIRHLRTPTVIDAALGTGLVSDVRYDWQTGFGRAGSWILARALEALSSAYEAGSGSGPHGISALQGRKLDWRAVGRTGFASCPLTAHWRTIYAPEAESLEFLKILTVSLRKLRTPEPK